MAKQIIRLTETDLHNMIMEAVKKAAEELTPSGQKDMFGKDISVACVKREKQNQKRKKTKSSIEKEIEQQNKKKNKEEKEYKHFEKKGYKQVPMFSNEDF